MSKGKKIELQSPNSNLRLITGAVDNYKESETIYLIHTCWVHDKGNGSYLSDKVKWLVKKIRAEIKQNIYTVLKNTNFINDEYILDIDIGEENYNNSSKLHLSIELNFNQKKPILPLKDKNGNDLIPQILYISDKIFNQDFLKESEDLFFVKKRMRK